MATWEDRPPLTDRQERHLCEIARTPDGTPTGNPRLDDRVCESLLARGLVARVTDIDRGTRRWVVTLTGRDLAEEVA